MDFDFGDYKLRNLSKINVILGKNGCGKSILLRDLDQKKRATAFVRYTTPERGGAFVREGSIENNMRNPDWLPSIRGQNRSDLFRQVSESELRRLETNVLRKIEKDPKLRFDSKYTFDTTLEDLNNLLEHVEIVRSEDGNFKIRDRHDQKLREAASLSSGESELISLGIEVLSYSFASECDQYAKTDNWFLFDEPDVHLHPDLQHRLMRLLVDAAQGRNFRTLIATHSTTIVSALGELTDVHVAFMGHRQRELNFEAAGPALKAVMPIFGAHPLSNVFNRRPILLVEGEDDERIWQQASRTSQGEINVWPCPVSGIRSLNEYEEKARSILDAVYDDAVAFSLRDRDDDPYHIDDLGPVIRMRLNCRASENLILTDDVLELLKTDWNTLKNGLEKWLTENDGHVQYPALLDFKNGGWDRRNGDLKPLRVLLLAISGSNKPWEIAVGQAIADLKRSANAGANSLCDFLGEKLVRNLKLHP